MENKIENNAMFKLTYGLFVLSVNDGVKDNGCIVNTVSMLTENPKRITVYVNKLNYTEQMIRKSGVFNVSVLTESAPFDIFKQFGFSSGRDVYKFAGKTYPRTSNGLYYLPEHTNAVISAKVTDILDYDTHTLFVAEVTEAKVLSAEPSVTYEYYFAISNPSPEKRPRLRKREIKRPSAGCARSAALSTKGSFFPTTISVLCASTAQRISSFSIKRITNIQTPAREIWGGRFDV